MDFLPDTRGQKRIKSLLLLYLFVARTLGDCPKPVLIENTVLTNEALLLNEFPDNIEISLECANGYIKESGSGIMKCIAGAWGDLDITCKKKDCGPPPPKPHMTFDLSQGTLFGAVALVKCAKGYSVKGLAYKQCYSAGWTAKSTTCQIKTCNKPDEVANGRSSWNSDDPPKYGDHIEYFCDEGHTLIGNNTIVCTENGDFDSTPPQCQGVTKPDVFTTQMVTTPTSTPRAQEASTSADSDRNTAHRDTTLTASATTAVPLSARDEGESWTASDHTTSTSTTITITPTLTSTMSSYFQEERDVDGIVHTNTDVGYAPVIISVVCVTLVVCIVLLFIHKLQSRKGSYDTREDLKPELLQFQNL